MNLKSILTILMFIGFFIQSNAQCESINFNSQADVDAWVAVNSSCIEIQTEMYIGPAVQGGTTDISDLSGLENIQWVFGTISIIGNPNLTSLNGLHNLTEASMGLYIENNDGLTNLQGLGNIETLIHDVVIDGNDNLINLQGLNSLTMLENFRISNNSSLVNLVGLESVASVNFNFTISNNNNLLNLQGLEGLNDVIGEVIISENASLENLTGLDNLITSEILVVQNNPSLTSLQGLGSLSEVWQLFDISDNNALTSLNGMTSFNQGNGFIIRNNNALTSLIGLSNLNFVGIYFEISNNDNLNNLEGLEGLNDNNGDIFISNNAALTDLTGLNNLMGVFSLTINDNPSLTSLNGLQGLTTVDFFQVENNDALISLDGVGALDFVFHIDILGNDALTNIQALDEIVDWTTVGQLNIYDNISLSQCSTFSICDNLINAASNFNIDVFNNAIGCNSVQEIEAGCDFSTVHGSLLLDEGNNCIVDNDTFPLAGWKIIAESPQYSRIAFTDSLGQFKMHVLEDEYTIAQVAPNSYWNNCPNTQSYNIGSNDSIQVDLLSSIDSDCPLLEVEIGAPLLRRCFDNHFTVNWKNVGAAVQAAYIEINTHEFFGDFQSSTPFTINADGNLIFDLGDVEIGDHGTIKFTSLLSCDADFDQVLCLTANIFPNEICNTNNTSYSGAELFLDGRCDGGILFLFIENGGSEDMAGPSLYRLFKNAELIETDSFNLTSGETFEMEIPADGCTYRLETEQVDDYPIETYPSITVEGCQVVGEDFATGFFLVHPVEDYGDSFDRFCMPVIGSYDPNDKQGFPIGFGDQHFIEQNQSIDYLVRFQNTGSDTAFNVVVLDTLSANFDMASIELGASSHPFQFDIIEDRTLQFTFENIMLPDSNVNEPGSNGFFNYTVRQLQDLPMGTTFENSASIYFDFNDPVKTNTTFHSLGIATTIDTTSIVLCGGGIYNGVTYTESTSLFDTIAFSVFENISRTDILVVVPTQTVVDTIVEIGTVYNGIVYEMDTTLQEILVDQYGCDSIVITNVLIQPLSQYDIENNISVVVSPNPFKEKTQFEISHLNYNFGKIELFDAVGKNVLSKTFNEKTFALEAEQLVQGVYFYRIILDEKYHVSGRIVKE